MLLQNNRDFKLNKEGRSGWIMLNILVTLYKRKNSFSLMYLPNQELKWIKNKTNLFYNYWEFSLTIRLNSPNKLEIENRIEMKTISISKLLINLLLYDNKWKIKIVYICNCLKYTRLLRVIKIYLVVFEHDWKKKKTQEV